MKDGGVVPQQATTILHIKVNDTDDNMPQFQRAVVKDCF